MLILLTLLMLLQVFFEDNLKKIQEFLGLSVYSASMPVGRDLSVPAEGLGMAAHSTLKLVGSQTGVVAVHVWH